MRIHSQPSASQVFEHFRKGGCEREVRGTSGRGGLSGLPRSSRVEGKITVEVTVAEGRPFLRILLYLYGRRGSTTDCRWNKVVLDFSRIRYIVLLSFFFFFFLSFSYLSPRRLIEKRPIFMVGTLTCHNTKDTRQRYTPTQGETPWATRFPGWVRPGYSVLVEQSTRALRWVSFCRFR